MSRSATTSSPSGSACRRAPPRRWSSASTSSASPSTRRTTGFGSPPTGRRVALRMLRRHRLLELFLAETLDLPVGPRAPGGRAARALALRGARGGHRGAARQPDARSAWGPDPVGRSSSWRRPETISLAELDPGAEARFVRVSDADPAILRHLGERGLKPGRRVRLVEREPFGGPFVVRVGRRTESLPPEIAQSMRLEAPA